MYNNKKHLCISLLFDVYLILYIFKKKNHLDDIKVTFLQDGVYFSLAVFFSNL